MQRIPGFTRRVPIDLQHFTYNARLDFLNLNQTDSPREGDCSLFHPSERGRGARLGISLPAEHLRRPVSVVFARIGLVDDIADDPMAEAVRRIGC